MCHLAELGAYGSGSLPRVLLHLGAGGTESLVVSPDIAVFIRSHSFIGLHSVLAWAAGRGWKQSLSRSLVGLHSRLKLDRCVEQPGDLLGDASPLRWYYGGDKSRFSFS